MRGSASRKESVADIQQMRQLFVDRLHSIAQRPLAFGRDAGGAFHTTLLDLLYIDDVEETFSEELARFGKRGVVGPFQALFGDGSYPSEHISVFAAFAADFEYLETSMTTRTPVEPEAFRQLNAIDVTMEEVQATFGEPALHIGDNVIAYQVTGGWAFCDFVYIDQPRYEMNSGLVQGRSTTALLRDVRLPNGPFLERLVLSRLGKELRWGLGWVLLDPEGADQMPPGVHAQLREISNTDPSERHDLRSPTPKWAHHVR